MTSRIVKFTVSFDKLNAGISRVSDMLLRIRNSLPGGKNNPIKFSKRYRRK